MVSSSTLPSGSGSAGRWFVGSTLRFKVLAGSISLGCLVVWSSTTPSRTGVVGQIHNPKTAGKSRGRQRPSCNTLCDIYFASKRWLTIGFSDCFQEILQKTSLGSREWPSVYRLQSGMHYISYFVALFEDLKDHCWQWQWCWLRMLPPCNVWVARSFWWLSWWSKSTTGPGRHQFWMLWTWWYASCLPFWWLWPASSLHPQQVMFWKSWTVLAWQSWLAWLEWFLASEQLLAPLFMLEFVERCLGYMYTGCQWCQWMPCVYCLSVVVSCGHLVVMLTVPLVPLHFQVGIMILCALLALVYRQAIGSQNELKIMTVGNTPPPAEAHRQGPMSAIWLSILWDLKYSGVHGCRAAVLQRKHKYYTVNEENMSLLPDVII